MSALLAYIDPGSGTLLLQMLIAGAIGGLWFVRSLPLRLVNAVFRRRG